MSKIVRLEAEAFKRIRAVEITPAGNIVQIKGANGSGKSSCLDAIAAAIGGEKLSPEVPIKRGETKAHVTVELENLIVTRRWTDKGSYLEVSGKDGGVFKSPQKILDSLVGALSFDPLSFTRLAPDKRAKLVADLVGVDLSLLDAERKKVFDERTVVNREAARLAAQVPAPVVGEVPDEEVSVEAILDELQAAEETKRANDKKRGAVAELVKKGKEKADAIVKLKADLAKAEEELAKLRADHKTASTEAKDLTDPDVAAIRAKSASLKETNASVRQKKERSRLQAAAEAKKAEADELTARLGEIDAEKEAKLKSAKFPVDGLSLSDGDLMLNGLPFDQASSAEQLRVSLAMGLALNPKLRVVLIRDGSLLDEKSLAMVAEMAKAADAQVWLETVGTEGPAGILIEDGTVAAAPVAETKGRKKKDAEPEPVPEAKAEEPQELEKTAPAFVAAPARADDDSLCPF
jgi:energy-coupling factor transporter ATP-binding protein EcfA2